MRGSLLISIKEVLCLTVWLFHDKSGEYKLGSCLPKHEIEAIVRTFYPAIVSFFESKEGQQEFEEWKSKKTIEVIKKNKKGTSA